MKFKEDQISIINRHCKMEGHLDFKGHLIVEGTIDGVIHAESIFTEKDSHITATVHATSLSIAGFFEGEIESDMLTLLKTSHVKGDIRCYTLIVDEGATLNGNVKFISQHPSQENPT